MATIVFKEEFKTKRANGNLTNNNTEFICDTNTSDDMLNATMMINTLIEVLNKQQIPVVDVEITDPATGAVNVLSKSVTGCNLAMYRITFF